MKTDSSPVITNTDLFLLALYRLGGAGKYVDVEHVFMEMWRLAPSRFSWRKYQQPNYKSMSQTIADISHRGQADLLLGDAYSRQLSAKGVEWAESRLPQLERIASGEETARPERRPSQRVVTELSKARLVRAFLGEGVREIDRDEVARLLRCAPDAPRDVWRERLETLRSASRDAGRGELLEFLEFLEKEKPTWYGGRSDDSANG